MPIETKAFLKAIVSPTGFTDLFPDIKIDSKVAELTKQVRLTKLVMAILAAGEGSPSSQDALGTLCFTQIVRTCDDILDEEFTECPSFSDAETFRQYLLSSELVNSNGVMVGQIFDRCLECFPPMKQDLIRSFLDNMVSSHLTTPQKGIAGEYSYQDALAYRTVTNEPFTDIYAELTKSSKSRFRAIGGVWQLIDDALDWQEDIVRGTKNLFLGMANDVWDTKGNPVGKELSYLEGQKGKPEYRWRDVSWGPLWRLRSSNIAATRRNYLREIDSLLPKIDGRCGRIMGGVAHTLLPAA